MDQNDMMAFTSESASISGIPYVMEADAAEARRILG